MVTTLKPVKTLRTYQPRQETNIAELWNTSLPIDVLWGIYARQSSPAQLIKHPESTEMQTDDLRQWLLDKKVRRENIALFDADLGKSGTLRIDQRSGLQELVSKIQADIIKAVLVYRVSRLFRDDTGVQYNTFAQICREHNCILATADGMFFNFNNDMHRKMFRYLAEQAAEYLPQQMKMLYEARVRKAKRGYFVGFGAKPWGLIVDYNPLSPTYQKYIIYEPHARIVLELLERFYALEADFYALCRELEARPVLFPDFEAWVDTRNIPKKLRKKVPGGYHISDNGLHMLLTNPIYIGWLVVLGDIISRDNPFRIVPEDKAHLFWYAFDHLSDYTTDGKLNEKRRKEPRRFYQKYMNEIHALLHKKKIVSPQGRMFVHISGYDWTYQIVPEDYTVIRDQFCEIDTDLIDREVGKIFLARLQETHDLDEYQQFLRGEAEKVDNQIALIHTQLAKIDEAQEAILDEKIAIRTQINQQIKQAVTKDPSIDTDGLKAQLEEEAKPDLERLRLRSEKLDALSEELQTQLPTKEENEEARTARKFASFQTEVQKLIPVWDKKPLSVRAEFLNLFLEQAVFTVMAPHWVRLDLYWRHPAWQQDSMYIYRRSGMKPRWTDTEREIVKAYYPTAQREEVLKLLPTKTWRSIRSEAMRLGIIRPGRIVSDTPLVLTWSDMEFMRQEGILDLSTKYIASSRKEKAVCAQTGLPVSHK